MTGLIPQKMKRLSFNRKSDCEKLPGFGVSLCGGFLILITFPAALGFIFIWFVSAILTYALLSLFRPTIDGAWKTLCQSFRKNWPLR